MVEPKPRILIPRISIQSEPFDLAQEMERISGGDDSIGAIVSFTGLCRSEEGRLAALELEHYPGMAEAELRRVAEAAITRWPLKGLSAIHRYGRIRPGEGIVLVLAASSHRQAAFAATDFMMDFLKTKAPFWKKEHHNDGTSGVWVDAKETDDQATRRWQTD